VPLIFCSSKGDLAFFPMRNFLPQVKEDTSMVSVLSFCFRGSWTFFLDTPSFFFLGSFFVVSALWVFLLLFS